MPTFDPIIFNNNPLRKKLLKAIYNPNIKLKLSNKCLASIEKIIAKNNPSNDSKNRTVKVFNSDLYQLKNESYICHYIAKLIFDCQIMMVEQSPEIIETMVRFHHQLIIDILRCIYHDMQDHAPSKEDQAYENEYWKFIEDCIKETITLNYNADKIKDLYSDYILFYSLHTFIKNNIDFYDHSKFHSMIALDDLIKDVESYFYIKLKATFKTENDKSIQSAVLKQTLINIKNITEEKYDAITQSKIAKKLMARIPYMLVCFLLPALLSQFFLPELFSYAALAYLNSLIIVATFFTIFTCLEKPRYILPAFLMKLFEKSLNHEASAREVLQTAQMPIDESAIRSIANFKRYAVIDGYREKDYLGSFCLLIVSLMHVNMGAYSLTKQKRAMPNSKSFNVVYTRFGDNSPTFDYGSFHKEATHGGRKLTRRAALIENARGQKLEDKKHSPQYTLPKDSTGALIQGHTETEKNSMIYVEFPKHDATHEPLIREMKAGVYSFCSGRRESGFKTTFPGQYRFKLFDKKNVNPRWDFQRDGNIAVVDDNGNSKEVPRYVCYSYKTK